VQQEVARKEKNVFSNAFRYLRENLLGTATITLSLSYMFLGLPAQIFRIFQTRSVNDISITMFSLLAIQSYFWVAYGIQKKDWFVVTANVFGGLFATIIVFQYILIS
jgi:uncharacterized protein with PQ loop repeat